MGFYPMAETSDPKWRGVLGDERVSVRFDLVFSIMSTRTHDPADESGENPKK